ncbi:MAG: hypothetical protein ACT4OO_08580 [Nitrospiraceae bacterium]
MHNVRLLVGVALLTALLVSGCASTRQSGMNESDTVYTPQSISIYSVMDSTSLIYSDPAAASPMNDNPIRWTAFILHPIGQLLDYGVNRPLYGLASLVPYLFGYTSEDSMLDSQRR